MKKTVVGVALVVALSLGCTRLLETRRSDTHQADTHQATPRLAGAFSSASRAAAAGEGGDTTGQGAGDLRLTRWAADSLLGSPVSIALDDQGRAYVTQTTRRKSSNLDIRSTSEIRDVVAYLAGLKQKETASE